MKFKYDGIVLQEVPDEISIAFTLLGCPKKCIGCHSSDYWKDNIDPKLGKEFNFANLVEIIENPAFIEHEHASCLLFLGGEWKLDYFLAVINNLKDRYHRSNSNITYKFCWYTSLEPSIFTRRPEVLDYFDYIKTGEYIENLGPLTSKTTNQQFFSRVYINHTELFQRNRHE